jgi:glycosyltransferase involved in cell wall biosynthesis
MTESRQNPLLSVRLMTYNQAPFIAKTMESIMMQRTAYPVEVVVGDDFSSDGTLDIIRSFNDSNSIKIKILERSEGDEYWQKRRRYGRLCNFVDIMENCRGDYIALLDGDDYWTSPHKLQRQADFLADHPECSMCFHPVQVIDETGEKATFVYPSGSGEKAFDFFNLLKENFIRSCSVMYRRYDDFEFPEWFRKVKFGDWPLHLLMASRGRIGFIDEVMSVYRVHGDGVWESRPMSENIPLIIDMLRFVDVHFSGRYHAQIKETIGRFQYSVGRLHLQGNRHREALPWAWRSLMSCRGNDINEWRNRFYLLAKSLLRRRAK